MSTPTYYKIAGEIDVKPILDKIINDAVLAYGLTGAQAFDLGNLLKYRIRAGKKDIASIEDDIKKALNYERMLQESLGL